MPFESIFLLLYRHNTTIRTNILRILAGNIVNNNERSQQTNEYTSLHKYKSLTLYFRKDDVLLCVRDEWGQGQTAILTQVLLLTMAAFLLHLGWGCSITFLYL